MTSEVTICQFALSHVRGGSINSLDDNSVQAQQCKLFYPILRDRILKESWGFNHKIQTLAVLTTDIFNWAFAYQYPVDCLKINRLVGAYEQLSNVDSSVISRLLDSQLLPLRGNIKSTPYEIFNFANNKVIGANESELRIDYAAKVTDPNLFTDDFTMAFSHLLASEIAVPIVGGKLGREFRGDELKLYNGYLSTALADDMNEGYQEPPLSELETIRR